MSQRDPQQCEVDKEKAALWMTRPEIDGSTMSTHRIQIHLIVIAPRESATILAMGS
jgi:hypothetical protein